MRTRRGLCYPKSNSNAMTLCFDNTTINNKNMKKMKRCRAPVLNDNGVFQNFNFKRDNDDLFPLPSHYNHNNNKNVLVRASFGDKDHKIHSRKRSRTSPALADAGHGPDFFDALPDDLLISVLCKLSSSASCSADFINVLLTCKRLNGLGLNSMVLSKASSKAFAIKATNWSESSHRFLKLCADAGNVEACYTLGMIRFYCLQNRGSGASLMAKAAINSHAHALYSLAVIQFNGSGGTKSDKDLRAGVALCARAAFLGHVDALRELGHCLQDGYGVRQNVAEGRRFLVQANARELATALASTSTSSSYWLSHPPTAVRNASTTGNLGCPLLSDFGCNVPQPESHPANRFLVDWFKCRAGVGSGLRLCSHSGCGRPETRRHEFRRCSVCGAVNYCSRACQALDWKLRHKTECAPMERWVEADEDNAGEGDGHGGVGFEGEVNGGES